MATAAAFGVTKNASFGVITDIKKSLSESRKACAKNNFLSLLAKIFD